MLFEARVRWILIKDTVRLRREKLEMAIAWRVPSWLVYWCSIRLVAHATRVYSDTAVPDLRASDAIKVWGQ